MNTTPYNLYSIVCVMVFSFVLYCALVATAHAGQTLPEPEPVQIPELNQVPEAFRDLAKPQTTVADFNYGGRYLTSTTVVYTPTTVTILDPAGLVNRIQDLASPATVEAALTGEISSNPARVCQSAHERNCGQLSPDTAGVIFDAYRFRADLFVAESYLQTQTLFQSKYLPESSSGIGMIQGFSATTSGFSHSDNDQENYSVYGNTLIGWKENHLVSHWDYSKENHFAVDTLYLNRDVRGLQMGAGYLDYSNLMTPEFASNQQVLGIKIGSSMDSRVDATNVNATPVRVFTTGRRRVEVLRDNRLIYATSVDAGSQELGTRTFPQGSYNITIRIYDGSVLVQELTRFFTKSVRLPPADEIIWYVEGGEMTRRTSDETMPDGLSEWLIRGGATKRLMDNAALEIRASATDDDKTAEAELFYQGDGWDVATTGMVGNDETRGAALEASTSLGPLYLSYYHRRLWNDNYQPDQANNTSLLDEGFESRSLSASSAFLGGSLSATYSYNKQDYRNARETIYGLSWYRNILRIQQHDLDLQLNYSESETGKVGTVGLTLRRHHRDWNYSARGQSRWEKNDNQPSDTQHGYAVDARRYHRDFLHGNAETGLRYEDLTGNEKVLGGDVKYEQARFRAEALVDHIDSKDRGSFFNYTGRIDTSFALNTSGAGFGGGQTADSAIMINIEGSRNSTFDALVNNSPAGLAKGDSKTVIPLSPYGTYQVEIRPRGTQFYNYDQSIHSVTLYPGNVETISFQSHEELVLLGKLVDPFGNAIESAVINGQAAISRTDQYGIFQVRLPASETQLSVNLENDSRCTAMIPNHYEKRGGVGLVGVIECE